MSITIDSNYSDYETNFPLVEENLSLTANEEKVSESASSVFDSLSQNSPTSLHEKEVTYTSLHPQIIQMQNKEIAKHLFGESASSEIGAKYREYVEAEDYSQIKEILEKAFENRHFIEISGNHTHTNFFATIIENLETSPEKVVKLFEFVIDTFEIDLNDRQAPALPALLSNLPEFYGPIFEDPIAEALNPTVDLFIAKGARIDIEDSVISEILMKDAVEHLTCNAKTFVFFNSFFEKVDMINKPYFQVYTEKLNLIDYSSYIHAALVTLNTKDERWDDDDVSDSIAFKNKIHTSLIKNGAIAGEERKTISKNDLEEIKNAILQSDLNMIDLLVKNGIDLDYPYNNLDKSVFHLAYDEFFYDLSEQEIAEDLETSRTLSTNFTPECLKFLVEKGYVDLTLRDYNLLIDFDSSTPVFYSLAFKNDTRYLEALVELGMDVNQYLYRQNFRFGIFDTSINIEIPVPYPFSPEEDFSIDNTQDFLCSYFDAALKDELIKTAIIFAKAGASAIYQPLSDYRVKDRENRHLMPLDYVKDQIEQNEAFLNKLEKNKRTLLTPESELKLADSPIKQELYKNGTFGLDTSEDEYTNVLQRYVTSIQDLKELESVLLDKYSEKSKNDSTWLSWLGLSNS
ncbi:MAG: hypothetical protein S4CHLAM37_12710 [Chlamydiia bacterium]|nr:hypothetical protein [Chlamydiia bacterium]